MIRDDVLAKLTNYYQELTERYAIASLFLFGSVARDEASADSDVDLLVEFKQPVGLFEFIEFFSVQTVFSINGPRRVTGRH